MNEMSDEQAAAIFANALEHLLEPLHGIIVHVGEIAVMVFRDGEEKNSINCSQPDPSLLEIPNGTILPIQCHEIPEDSVDNFIIPTTGKLH